MQEEYNHAVSVKVPAVKFVSNKDFQRKSVLYEGDSGFLRYRRKWMQTNGDSQANREVLTTLLATQGDNTSDNIEKVIAENVSYRDLGSLTHQDLELMGFSRQKQRDELLAFFAKLPNQDPSLQHIHNLKEASKYNLEIINTASSHLNSMGSALAAANYKLQIMPPEDVIVGEKSFASRFVLEALNELYGVTDDIEKEISAVESIIYEKLQITANTSKEISKSSIISNFYLTASLILGSLSSIGALLALYIWKY